MRRLSMLVLCGVVLCLIAAFWLSGYRFSAAKNRATLAALAVIIPFIIIFAGLFK